MQDAQTDTKSFTTGFGQRGRWAIWTSILRHHRERTATIAKWDAKNSLYVKGMVDGQEASLVLDLGCGSRAGVVLGLRSLGVPVTGIDYDVPEPRVSLAAWARIAKRNGFERAAKTAARQVAFDRAYYRELAAALGAKLDWDMPTPADAPVASLKVGGEVVLHVADSERRDAVVEGRGLLGWVAARSSPPALAPMRTTSAAAKCAAT